MTIRLSDWFIDWLMGWIVRWNCSLKWIIYWPGFRFKEKKVHPEFWSLWKGDIPNTVGVVRVVARVKRSCNVSGRAIQRTPTVRWNETKKMMESTNLAHTLWWDRITYGDFACIVKWRFYRGMYILFISLAIYIAK